MEIPRRLMKYMETASDTGRGGEWRLMKRKPRFMPVLIIKFRGISIVFLLSILFFFSFLLSRFESVSPSYSSVLRGAPRLWLTIFLRLMRGKRAIWTSLTNMGRVLSLLVLSNELYSCILFVPDTRIYFLVKLFIIVIIIVLFLNFFRIQRLVSSQFEKEGIFFQKN